MFAYAGFEIVGLAATETPDPVRMIPKAIFYTVMSLLFLYIASTVILLFLIPVNLLSGNSSPFVAALLYHHIESGAKIINAVLIAAILSTMLASIFGLARTLHSLAIDGFAPRFIINRGNIPYKGILISGLMIFIFFSLSFFLPETVYLFLVSSSGFALLFTYLMIVLSHYKYRKKIGCPYQHCQLPIFPFSSWFTAISLIVIILSMPFVKGQGTGLIAGGTIAVIYFLIYLLFLKKRQSLARSDHFEK
jgi:AAT family amino acid transporter